ncbi:hypothetical protein KTG15_02675 [Methanobacterium sp. YSL]|nr:hypothetical protein [Methanobacterium sp. YSL]
MKREIKNIELLNALKNLEITESRLDAPEHLLKDFKEHVYDYIGQDPETIKNRMAGLKKEDEFLLFSLLLGNVSQATKLDQKKYIDQKLIIPDFLFAVRMPELDKDGLSMVQRFFVEVKKMRKGEDEFYISLKYYEKIKFYADLYNFPLYFAIQMDNEHPAWFLVLAETFETYGEIQNRKVNNREEKCFVIKGVELLNHDYSGMFLSNYLTLVPAGLKIDFMFDILSEETYGNVIDVQMAYESKVVSFGDENELLGSIFFKICNYLRACNKIEGAYAEIVDKNDKTIKWQTDIDFYILYYHLILSCYLYIKNQVEEDKNPKNIDNIPYFLETFNELDNKIVMMIKYVINQMAQKNMIKPIKMIPKLISKE